MIFSSVQYAFFLPVVVLAYWGAPVRARLWVLLLASYVFYAAWNPLFLRLIVGLTGANYALGLLIHRLHARSRLGLTATIVGVGVNLAVLGAYKYAHFVAENLVVALSWLGVVPALAPPSPFLPLGLSFFTFEFIHYLVDVHRGEAVVRSAPRFAVFAAFFPTQVAGPIKRYEAFVPQLERPPEFVPSRFGEGCRLLVTGLFKKVALADNLAPLVVLGFTSAPVGQGGPSAADVWLVVVAFALQIYFDFSGYSNMGRGSALLLGYEVPENFRHPYLAVNVSDFWRRWHISLSTWLRDYVYIPLGGSRRRRARNLLLTMVIGGFWHGANWTFIVWGAMHGALLIAFHALAPARVAWVGRISMLAGWALTFVLVCIGWIFFRAESVGAAASMLVAMGGLAGERTVLLPTQRLIIVGLLAGTLAVEWALERSPGCGVHQRMSTVPGVRGWLGSELRPIGYALLFVLTLLVRPDSRPTFIYFQF